MFISVMRSCRVISPQFRSCAEPEPPAAPCPLRFPAAAPPGLRDSYQLVVHRRLGAPLGAPLRAQALELAHCASVKSSVSSSIRHPGEPAASRSCARRPHCTRPTPSATVTAYPRPRIPVLNQTPSGVLPSFIPPTAPVLCGCPTGTGQPAATAVLSIAPRCSPVACFRRARASS